MSKKSHAAGIWSAFFSSILDWFVIAAPVAFAIRYVSGWRNDTLLFVVAGIGIIPLAGWMGRATDALAERTGAGIGGLLNVTFGNAAELIIALMALSKGLTTVVKASMTGSIIANMLLVTGASALAGGLRYRRQCFNETAARASATTMSLASFALIIPTIFHITADRRPGSWSHEAEQSLSVAVCVVLLVSYALSLWFSLGTHRELFRGSAGESSTTQDEPALSLWTAVAMLAISTVLIGFLSEFLVGAIEAARTSLGLTETFVGVIIVAIVGNAAEHSTAVAAALHNKMDLSLRIATGSSMQIALFVVPVLVFASYAFGRPMDLEFSVPEIASIGMAVWVVTVISGDGESNWFEGVQLLAVYLVLAALFFFLPQQQRPNGNSHDNASAAFAR